MVKAVGSKAEFDEVLKSNPLVVVDFTATWCGPCRMIGPKFADMEKDFPSVKFIKVDVDEVGEVSEQEGISAMPTFKAYKGGKMFDELVGASEDKLKALITKLAAS